MGQQSENSAGEQSANASRRADGSDETTLDSPANSLDAIFEILGAERRRNVLYVLYRRTGPVTLVDLADAVASFEGADPERVTASLHHVHLPKLVDAAVVEYDAEAGIVCLVEHTDRFRHYLTTAAEDEYHPIRRAAGSATLSEF